MSRIAESVLVLATYVAGATGARKVDDEHLLAALVEHPLGGARRVLRRVSDLDALPFAEERALARAVAWSAPEVPRLRRSRRLDGVVRDAGVRAAPPGCSSVDLLVQLATSHTDSGDALRTAGATPDRIGAAVEQFRRGLDETETWLPPGSPVDGVPGRPTSTQRSPRRSPSRGKAGC
ncbi:MAG: Clp protease N-terminal domain-containing protein [Acidimicrobiales bacterium]